MPVEIVKQQIRKAVDILRNEPIDSEEYHLILFLLSLYKDGTNLTKLFSDKANLRKKFAVLNNPILQRHLPVFESFEPSIRRLSPEGLASIIQALHRVDMKALSHNFANVFDSVLYQITQSQGRHGGEFMQPAELTRFICTLADLPKKATVFNPFAGLASFGVYLDQDQHYFGQEIDPDTWALGTLRIMAYERSSTSQYICGDSILNWPESKTFDLVVANPPYGVHLGQQYREVHPNVNTIEQFLIEKSINSLNANGKLIALLPQGVLFRGSHERRLRKRLITDDLIDTIISLPGGVLLNTSTPLVIIVISKSKKVPGKVRFIKADELVESNISKQKVLNDARLSNIIQDSYQNSHIIRIIDNEQINANDYNLNVPRYFSKHIEGVKLKEIIEVVNGRRSHLPDSGKMIRIKDLKEDKLGFKLDLTNVEKTALHGLNLRLIDESCILVATRGRALKPTLFEFTGEPIFLNPDIVSFKVNTNIIDIAYLINELSDQYVETQLDSYRQGAAIPVIGKNDLFDIVIKLPSIEEQRAKMQGIVELSNTIKLLQEEKNMLAHGVGNRLYENVSTIKHALGKPLLNIGSSLRNIEKAFSKLNADWEHIKLNERYDITIKDSFDSIFSNLKFIHSVLKNNESTLDVTNYELTEVDFLNFIRDYVKRIKSAERTNLITKLDIHPDIKIVLDNKIVLKSNVELLEIAFNAIVENANMHAFTDHLRKYKLEFRVSLNFVNDIKSINNDTIGRFKAYVKVEVANNGHPFPKNYSFKKFIKKNSFAGETGNTGQGGFDLNEIIKYHNEGKSTLELITDDRTTEFTTTYSFLLPLNR